MSSENVSIATLNAQLAPLGLAERLAHMRAHCAGPMVFTTSLGLEDQLLTHIIAKSGLNIALVTLDTGRLFEETHKLWAEVEARYGVKIQGYYPDAEAVQKLVAQDGANGFYHTLEKRKTCCHIRKVEPLGRALAGAKGWITGLRADQSATREQVAFAEYHNGYGLIKFNPLADWPRAQIWDECAALHVPINPLHHQGFASIGCAPCTRALAAGEHERDGRWWWEKVQDHVEGEAQECGLHVDASGKLVRGKASASAHETQPA
jgi:phosphoadenosine phosphosulfate reductase